MTYRYKPLTDDDLSELHAAAHMADAAGFRRVQVEPESVVSMVEEIKDLRAKMTSRDAVEEEHDGFTYLEHDGRVQFIFDSKPDAETRTVLKKRGFRWSPSRGAWVRQLNDRGIYAANQVMRELDQ